MAFETSLRSGLAWSGLATTMPKKCAIQSWNLNNGNKNYEQEYFNVGRCHICIRKPLRVPHGPCHMPNTQHWPQDEVDSPPFLHRCLCGARAQLCHAPNPVGAHSLLLFGVVIDKLIYIFIEWPPLPPSSAMQQLGVAGRPVTKVRPCFAYHFTESRRPRLSLFVLPISSMCMCVCAN